MNFAMAFHAGDKEQVAHWLSWAEELGAMGRHKLWLLPAKGQSANFKTSIPFTVLEDSYGVQSDWSASNNAVRDAAGANSMVRQFAWHFFLGKLGPWMFCEPDAIPLREGWHDTWEDEYRSAGKPFMGAFVPGKEDAYPDHSTGNMVLPENALALSKLLMLPTYAEIDGRRVELAFDIAAAPEILGPNFHDTKLIQHVFRGPAFTKMDDLARIDPKAVIWHSDKDGGLIRLLRAKRVGTPVEAPSAAVAGSTPANGNAGSIPAPTVTPQGKYGELEAALDACRSSAPRVQTYFRPCVNLEALAEQKRILVIWEKNWREHGWEPVILTEVHARKHPEFEKYRAAFEKLPTVSPKEYEMACWLRWVAMAASGGGVMTDYDVLNNGWTPSALPVWSLKDGPEEKMAAPFIFAAGGVPCVLAGTSAAFENAAGLFATTEERFIEAGRLHVSDMLLVKKWRWPHDATCREYGTPEWDKAKLIHFSHAACGKEQRSVRMKEWSYGATYIGPTIAGALDKECCKIIKELPPEQPRTVSDCISELVEFSKKDGFAKGRIVKQLRAAGLVTKK